MKRTTNEVEGKILHCKTMIAKWQRDLASAETCKKCCYLNQECIAGCPARGW